MHQTKREGRKKLSVGRKNRRRVSQAEKEE